MAFTEQPKNAKRAQRGVQREACVYDAWFRLMPFHVFILAQRGAIH